MEQAVKSVLLVGGLGTRLRSVVPSKPKALAEVGEHPFIELPIRQLATQGLRRLVLCSGHLAEQLEETLGSGAELGISIEYSRETTPLGTGGALRLAMPLLESCTEVLVMNGDSFTDLDFGGLLAFHRARGASVTLTAVPVEDAARYGTLTMAQDGRVLGFVEKSGRTERGTISAGIYVFSRGALERLPEGRSSLERDLLPRLVAEGSVFGFSTPGPFIDIGTPEDYARAGRIHADLLKRTMKPRGADSGAKND